MKLYKVAFYDGRDGHGGFSWHASKRAAEQAVAKYMRDNAPEPRTGNEYDDMYRRLFSPDRPTIETVDVQTTKAGLLKLLRMHASHPDNG